MANIFEKCAADCEVGQKKAAVADMTADEKRTTLLLSLTVSDKKALKMMAADAIRRLPQSSTSGCRRYSRRSARR